MLIEVAQASPERRAVVHNDINAWNETHIKQQRFRSTPMRSNPQMRVPTNNPIDELKILRMKLLNSPTPVKEPRALPTLSSNNTVELLKCDSSELRLPELKSFRELNLSNKENLPPNCNTQPLYKSKSVRIRKKELCRINLLPCRYNNSSQAIEKNIRRQLAEMERNRNRRPLALQESVDLRSSFIDHLKRIL